MIASFRSNKDGLVTGVRFYKGGAANGGTHVGHLWTIAGTLLGTVTFTGESDAGWQQALFQTPIPITANTIYVVSSFAPQGHYAADSGFFASFGVDTPPLHAFSNTVAGGNGVFNDNPSGGFPSQSFNATNYWVDVVFVDTEPLPPQVISTTPAAGAIDVSTIIAPVAVFSKSLVSMTVNSSTVLVTDTADNPVPFTVLYNPVNFSVTLLPQQELQPGQAYTVTLKAGPTPPFIIDSTGIPLPSDYTWSFTTATPPPPGAAISIWDDSVIPSNPIFPDSTPVEVGLKFRSNKDGLVTGVRFYKGGAANGGTHVGHLWTSTGTLLGTVTFTGESDAGWQQALFQTPVLIRANTFYVVSYFAPQGNYAADGGFFASSGVDNGPLHAPSDPFIGGNGVFNDNPSGGFPSQSFNATNYWVDVVFVDTEPLPPQVISTTPAPGVIDVSTIIAPVAVFSKSLVSMTVNSSTVLVTDTADNSVPFTVLYNPVNFSVTLLPQQELQPGQAYTVTLKAGPTPPFIIDSTGIPLPSDYTWSFTTATPPPPGAAISIWDDSVIPSNPIFPDSTPVEVGLKFRSNKDGLVTGVRFYKGGAANGGT